MDVLINRDVTQKSASVLLLSCPARIATQRAVQICRPGEQGKQEKEEKKEKKEGIDERLEEVMKELGELRKRVDELEE